MVPHKVPKGQTKGVQGDDAWVSIGSTFDNASEAVVLVGVSLDCKYAEENP